MRKLFFLFLLLVCGNAFADLETYSTWTNTFDKVTSDSLCSNGQILKKSGGVWICGSDDSTAGGGTLRVSEDGTFIVSADTIDFRTGLKASLVTGTKVMVSGDMATTTAPGIASFDTTNFSIGPSNGGVSIKDDGVALGTETTGGYADSVSEAGPATTATALAANGANCSAGSYPLGVDASGAVESCTSAFVSTDIDTSAELDTIVTDDTGSGALVFANTPTLVTPVIGAATGTSLNVSGSLTAGTTVIGTSSIATAICDMTNGGATLWDCPATSQGVTGERASGTFARTNSSTGWAVGVRGTANKTGAGNSQSSQAGLEGVVSLTGTSGTDTWAYGVRGLGTINGAGYTLTNFAGVYGKKMTETAGTLTNNYAGYYDGVLAVANGATSAGKFRILEDSDNGTNYTEFTVPAMAGNIAYTLPPDDGDAGEQLQTDGSGVLTWETAGSGGAETNSLETLTTGILSTEIPIGTAADTVVYAALSGDVTMTNGGVVSIGNDKVVEADLKAVDAASDEECLTYETTTGDFEWQTCGSGSDTNAEKEYVWPASATLPLEAADSIPPIGKDAGTNIDQLYVAFDSAADECRSVNFKVPSDVTSGTVTFKVNWYSAAATSGAAAWDFRHNGGVTTGTDPDQSLTLEFIESDTTAGTAGQLNIASGTETIANLGWSANEQVDGVFCRDGNGTNGTDDLTGDALAVQFSIQIPRA